MRSSADDDLWTSGRLSKLTRSYGRNENETLGALVNFYRLTQRARVVTETPGRIVTVVVIAFDSDADADRFVTAMVQAQLISVLGDGRLLIHGNEKRIAEQDQWLNKQIDAGKARAAGAERDGAGRFKKLNDLSSQAPASDQPETSRSQPSLVVSNTPNPINGETLTHEQKTVRGDADSPLKKKTGTRKSGTNPRALGTSPRQVRKREAKAKAEIERVANIKRVSDFTHDEVPQEVGLEKLAELKQQFRF